MPLAPRPPGNGGEVLGYAAGHLLPYLFLSCPEGYISELFVLAKGRAMGIGTRLLEEVKTEARERGCSRLRLLNSRRRESYKRGYYRKLGWEERKEMADFIFTLD